MSVAMANKYISMVQKQELDLTICSSEVISQNWNKRREQYTLSRLCKTSSTRQTIEKIRKHARNVIRKFVGITIGGRCVFRYI